MGGGGGGRAGEGQITRDHAGGGGEIPATPELGAVNLNVRNGKSAVQFIQRTNATVITELNRKKIIWVQFLNRSRALTVPDIAPNGIEFGAVKARCLNQAIADSRLSGLCLLSHRA